MYISDGLPVQFWLTGCQTFNEYNACGVHSKCFCQPWQCDDTLFLQFTSDTALTYSLQVWDDTSMLFTDEFVQGGTLYSYSFQPIALGICDKQIILKIIEEASPDAEVAKSDCLDIKTTHYCTEVMTYHNTTRNYAGLIYADISPETRFSLRVPAIFFHERFPEEDKAIELSDSKIINVSGQLKAQKLFQTPALPYYMHRKIMIASKHQFVEIQNKYWIREEGYQLGEGDRRWPTRKGSVWLTDRDFVLRNVL